MKKLALLLLLLLSSLCFSTDRVPLTATFRTATGGLYNGTLKLKLPFAGAVDTACLSPVTGCPIVPTLVVFSISNGNLPASAAIVANDSISPTNTYYEAALYNSYGALDEQFNLRVPAGSSFDIGQALQTSIITSNVSYISPAGLNLNNTWTGTQNFNNTVVFSQIPNSPTPTPCANGTQDATTAFVIACSPSLYDTSGTLHAPSHMVFGLGNLTGAGNVTITLSGSAVYSNASTFTCTPTDGSHVAAMQVQNLTAATFLVQGPPGDLVYFSCVGY